MAEYNSEQPALPDDFDVPMDGADMLDTQYVHEAPSLVAPARTFDVEMKLTDEALEILYGTPSHQLGDVDSSGTATFADDGGTWEVNFLNDVQRLKKRDMRIAVIRTTLPAAWLVTTSSLLAYALDWEVTIGQLLPWSPAIAIAGGALYRVARAFEGRFPRLGRIIFGSGDKPEYELTFP